MGSDDDLLRLLAEWVRRGAAAQRAINEILGGDNGSHPPTVGPEPSPRTRAARGLGKLRRQRQTTADMLSDFDPKIPRTAEELTFNPRRLGVLVRRGYLKKHRGGYIRTDKPFTV